MFLSLSITCPLALVVGTVLLLAFGARIRLASRVVGAVAILSVTVLAGEAAARIWALPSRYVEYGHALILGWGLLGRGRPDRVRWFESGPAVEPICHAAAQPR